MIVDDALEASFPEIARFARRRLLGRGTFGAVYEAFDFERGEPVALKVLRRSGGADLADFKREFRMLADLRHKNIVRLHELFSDDDRWFFTMELVTGTDFQSFVRGGRGGLAPTALDRASLLSTLAPAEEALSDTLDVPPAPSGALGAAGEDRLRSALRQLVEGLLALHTHGVLHRDLKPSNVLVSAERAPRVREARTTSPSTCTSCGSGASPRCASSSPASGRARRS